jgi:capsule polysaccharide modification protein KpsS
MGPELEILVMDFDMHHAAHRILLVFQVTPLERGFLSLDHIARSDSTQLNSTQLNWLS